MALATKRLLRYLKTYPDGGISFGVNRFESDQPTVGEQMQKLFDDKSLYGEMGFGPRGPQHRISQRRARERFRAWRIELE